MKKGFTLLELLVVIGIIALLVALGTTSYSTAQKKARDAKRKGELKAIQDSLEQYYSICGFKYPSPNGEKVPSSITCADPETTLMEVVPNDPKTAEGYNMTVSDDNSTYSICAPNDPPLESESTNPYCLSNLQ